MATIKFFLQSKKSPAGIYVRLRDGIAIDAKAKTKYAIDPNDWSVKKGRPSHLKDEAFKKLNEDLVTFSKDLLAHYNISVGRTTINSNWLKDFINPKPALEKPTDNLCDYFEFYINRKQNALRNSTVKKLRVVKHLVQRFQGKGAPILLKNVDLDFKQRFETYCAKEGYSHNTISKATGSSIL